MSATTDELAPDITPAGQALRHEGGRDVADPASVPAPAPTSARRAQQKLKRRAVDLDRHAKRDVRCSDPQLIHSSEMLWWLRHPRTAERPDRPLAALAAAVRIFRHVPSREVILSDGPGGRHIQEYLSLRRAGLPIRRWAKSVLPIPAEGQPLFSGRRMQATRTNMRAAAKQGMHCGAVPAELEHPDALEYRLWDADGQEVGGAKLVVDRDWALLTNLWAPGVGYYLIHGHVVEELQRMGVRFVLMHAHNAPALKPGLLYMQGRLGYEVVHLRTDSH